MTYKATKQDDGTYTIHNVEIFEECVREYDPNSGPGIRDRDWEPPNPPLPIERYVFDAKWMREAKGNFLRLKAVGYFPPIHVPIRFADRIRGFFGHIEKIDVVDVDGQKARLIADLRVNKDVFDLIADGKLPYISVEINNPNLPEISSLALLNEIPLLKFPLLIVNT